MTKNIFNSNYFKIQFFQYVFIFFNLRLFGLWFLIQTIYNEILHLQQFFIFIWILFESVLKIKKKYSLKDLFSSRKSFLFLNIYFLKNFQDLENIFYFIFQESMVGEGE